MFAYPRKKPHTRKKTSITAVGQQGCALWGWPEGRRLGQLHITDALQAVRTRRTQTPTFQILLTPYFVRGHQTRVADALTAISGRHIVPGAANSMPTNHPGRQIARGGPRRHPQHAVEDRGCRGHPQLETCVCMPNAPRKHMLQWQQGPRLAAKREIGHGLMREKHGGGGDGRSGGASCANRAHNRLE